MTEGHFERRLRRSRTRNAARRAALLESLDEHFGDRVEVSGANAGIHVLVWLRWLEARDLDGLIDDAQRAGVGIYTAAPYYLNPPREAGLLMGYASLAERQIRAGIGKLAEVAEGKLAREARL
jgi:GntR family transcriptional regulator/MocR family aminotransferase